MNETSVLEATDTKDQTVATKARKKLRSNGKSRRMKMLERMGCFSSETNGINIERASSLEEFITAYELVHKLFVKEGYILPSTCGLRIRIFEALPDTATFIAKDGDKIVGVTSLVIDSDGVGLPSDKAFKKEIDQLRQAGRKVCEGTNWTVAPEYRRSPVMTELMRCAFAYARDRKCTDMIADVSPSHKTFYELMSFETIGSQRNSSPEVDDPVVLVNLPITEAVDYVLNMNDEDNHDLASIRDFYIGTNPYPEKMEQWKIDAEARFFDVKFLRRFFLKRSHFLLDCCDEDFEAVCQQWGDKLLQKVIDTPLIRLLKLLNKLQLRAKEFFSKVDNPPPSPTPVASRQYWHKAYKVLTTSFTTKEILQKVMPLLTKNQPQKAEAA